MNVYSAYDNTLLFRGNPKEVADEFECALSTIYKEVKKSSLPNLCKDWYCRKECDEPLHRTVIDVYDCDTWELLNTCYSIQQATQEHGMNWDVIEKSTKGDLHRATGSGLRFQKRIL